MVMYRHQIPLIPAEEIGYQLGLTVPPDAAKSFFHARVSDTPPVDSGYGTQIQTPAYSPNKAFQTLHIPFKFSMKLASAIADLDELMNELAAIQASDGDALLCLNPGILYWNEYRPFTGHVVVFDKVIDGMVRIVDPEAKQPKWRTVRPSVLLEAIKTHGDQNYGGMWYLKPAR